MLDYRNRGLEVIAVITPMLMTLALGFSIGLFIGARYF